MTESAQTHHRLTNAFKHEAAEKRLWNFATFFILFFGFVVFFLHQIDFEMVAENGLLVPDSVNITQTIQNVWVTGETRDLGDSFFLLRVIYGWTWVLHPSLCFLVNVILVILCMRVYRKLAIERFGAPKWVVIGMMINPYVILAMPGPNKEIPLLLLTLLMVDVFAARPSYWLIKASLLSVPIILIRDGFGVFLLLSSFLFWLFGMRRRIYAVFIFTIFSLASCFWGVIGGVVPILSRNLEVYESAFGPSLASGALAASLKLDPLSAAGGLILFFFRLLYNMLSLAFFPIFLTADGAIYWIGVSYWVVGFLIVLSLVSSIGVQFHLAKTKSDVALLDNLMLGAWFLVSFSLFVQPRYLIPMLPLAFIAFSKKNANYRMLCIVVSLIASISMPLISAWRAELPRWTYLDAFKPPAYLMY